MFKIFKNKKPVNNKRPYRVYHRFIPYSKALENKDYVFGWGIDSSFRLEINRIRKLRGMSTYDDYSENYQHISRDGLFDVTGKLIKSTYHPLHDKFLVKKETGEKYHIDVVTIQHLNGKVLSVCIRKDGTKSHGIRYWESLTCKDPYILENIKENRKEFELIDKNNI